MKKHATKSNPRPQKSTIKRSDDACYGNKSPSVSKLTGGNSLPGPGGR